MNLVWFLVMSILFGYGFVWVMILVFLVFCSDLNKLSFVLLGILVFSVVYIFFRFCFGRWGEVGLFVECVCGLRWWMVFWNVGMILLCVVWLDIFCIDVVIMVVVVCFYICVVMRVVEGLLLVKIDFKVIFDMLFIIIMFRFRLVVYSCGVFGRYFKLVILWIIFSLLELCDIDVDWKYFVMIVCVFVVVVVELFI